MEILRRLLAPAALAALCACTAAQDDTLIGVHAVQDEAVAARAVALLPHPPPRPYRRLGWVEVRGLPGMPRRTVHDKLREEALGLGADAVIVARDVARPDVPVPPPADQALFGEPRPDPLERAERHPGPGSPRDATTLGGVYYEVSGEAIEFTDGSSTIEGGAS